MGIIEPWGNVLVVPAFNEEMNRCRSMVTLQARSLARRGVGTLLIDLYGTGESDGEYGDARWDIWNENVRDAIEWLDRQPGGCSAVLGIRLGVALALCALRNDRKKKGLIAWQPIVDGKTYFNQFMRTRIAANMDRTDIPRETTNGMRARLAEGSSIEVAGYMIHPELAMAIEKQQLGELVLPESISMTWFERSATPEGEISPSSTKVLEAWQRGGRSATVAAFDGPAFWSLYERSLASDLVNKTTDSVQQFRP